MSNSPEFIYPISTPIRKPEPAAGLSEYLQSNIQKKIEQLEPIKDIGF